MLELGAFSAQLGRVTAYGQKVLRLACAETFPATSAMPPIALGLLARTLEHSRAIETLVAAGCHLEARILARCCLENCFVAAAFAKQGEAFAQHMLDLSRADIHKSIDEFTSDESVEAADLDNAFSPALQTLILEMIDGAGKQTNLNLRESAEAGAIGSMYKLYKSISGDAAHPSIASIRRHTEVTEGPNRNFKIVVSEEPEVSEHERRDTLETAAIAVLGAAVSVRAALALSGLEDDVREIDELWVKP